MAAVIARLMAITIILFTTPAVFSQPPRVSLQNKLRARIKQYDTKHRSLAECILELAYRYELPTALQHVDRAAVEQPLSVILKDESIEQVINAIVAHASGYRVDFSGGLVQVYSPTARDDSLNRLNTLIGDFDVRELPAQEASTRLLAAFVHRVTPGAGFGGNAPYGVEPQRMITVQLKNARVYQILDAIVAQDGALIWVATVTNGRVPAVMQDPPWAIYDLRQGTKEEVLRKLRERAKGSLAQVHGSRT